MIALAFLTNYKYFLNILILKSFILFLNFLYFKLLSENLILLWFAVDGLRIVEKSKKKPSFVKHAELKLFLYVHMCVSILIALD